MDRVGAMAIAALRAGAMATDLQRAEPVQFHGARGVHSEYGVLGVLIAFNFCESPLDHSQHNQESHVWLIQTLNIPDLS